MKKYALRNVSVLLGVSLFLAYAAYIANVWLFSSTSQISPTEASFLEGIILIIVGILFFLGSGGINYWSQKAALLAAVAKAANKEVAGPSEIFRRDAWKPKGFTKLALILIATGTILLLIYFFSTYLPI